MRALRSMTRGGVIAIGLTAASFVSAPQASAQDQTPAKRLFGAATTPSDAQAQVFGGYAGGCLAGAVELAADGPGWQAMRPSRNRAWGHPDLIAFVEELSDTALSLGWPGLLIGDLAQPRGGPMLSGHRSHQIGIDADIWLRPAPERRFTPAERDQVSAISVVGSDGRTLTADWTPRHHALLRAAASDPRVARIFVNPAIKERMCADAAAAGENTGWLRRIRPWWGHDAHFHVRLHCPSDSPGCRPQAAPPIGDSCDQVAAWFAPPEPSAGGAATRSPRRDAILADLPPACTALVAPGAQ